jgi:hypothetical protein
MGHGGHWCAVETEQGPKLLAAWELTGSLEEATQRLALARRVAQLDSPHLTPVVACGLTAEGGTFVVYESPVLGKPLGARGEASTTSRAHRLNTSHVPA